MSYQPFFNPEESFSRSEIEAFQLERLQATVKHCMHSPFYQERFRRAGLTPADIRTLDDLRKIPFTTKQDLRDTYPFGIVSVRYRIGSARQMRAPALLQRHHRQSHGHPAHAAGPGRMGQCRGPLPVDGGLPSRGRFPEHIGLRDVHRRTRLPVRRREGGHAYRPRSGRQHPASAEVLHGLRHHRGARHPFLRRPPV